MSPCYIYILQSIISLPPTVTLKVFCVGFCKLFLWLPLNAKTKCLENFKVCEVKYHNFSFIFSILQDIETLGDSINGLSNDYETVKAALQIRFQNVASSSLPSNFYTVQIGSPVVRFNQEVAALFPGGRVPLALANIDSRAIGTQGWSSVTISRWLFSISTGTVQVSGLSNNIEILFPIVSTCDHCHMHLVYHHGIVLTNATTY